MAAEAHPHRTPAGGSPPPQATMGLLNYITTHSLDEDYEHASKGRTVTGDRKPPRPGRLALVALGLFGLLVATAAVQTARTASVQESGHENLVAQITDGQAALDTAREQRTDVQTQLNRAQSDRRLAIESRQALDGRLSRLCVWTGSCAVTGPGVKMLVDDAPNATSAKFTVLDEDLQRITNGLWQAGAEAVSINGQRLTQLSAIRVAGSTITVNYEPVSAPYTVQAIGDPKRLAALFVESTTGSVWLNQRQQLHLVFEMTSEDSLTIPAVASRHLQLRHTEELKGKS